MLDFKAEKMLSDNWSPVWKPFPLRLLTGPSSLNSSNTAHSSVIVKFLFETSSHPLSQVLIFVRWPEPKQIELSNPRHAVHSLHGPRTNNWNYIWYLWFKKKVITCAFRAAIFCNTATVGIVQFSQVIAIWNHLLNSYFQIQ